MKTVAIRKMIREELNKGKNGIDVVKSVMLRCPALFNEKAKVLSIYEQENARKNGVSVLAFLLAYVENKIESFNHGDYGAIGDAIEVICYYLLAPIVCYENIHVKPQGTIDFHYHGATVEIGHNGKTFTRCSGMELFDKSEWNAEMMLYNESDMIFYGIVPDFFKNAESLVQWTRKNIYMFSKEQFADMLNSVKKGGFKSAVKSCKSGVTIQYNDQFASDFEKYMKSVTLDTVGKYAKR